MKNNHKSNRNTNVSNKTHTQPVEQVRPQPDKGYRLMKEEDYTLTEEELIKTEHLKFSICMDSEAYSKIIGRRVFECGVCYECTGGCPIGGTGVVYVNDETGDLYVEVWDKRR